MIRILQGDCLQSLRTLPDSSVHTCVTSPPYWGLRSYLPDGHPLKHLEIGLEKTPDEYVAKMVEVFREVRRALRDDGTLWLNLGDSYATGAGSGRSMGGKCFGKQNTVIDEGSYPVNQPNRMPLPGLKPKDLVGIPWRAAFALQADGWYLRSDIIWHKPNQMPESVTDRPTKSHEYIFLLSKSQTYYYDAEAIKEPVTGNAHARGDGVNPKAKVNGPNSRMVKERTPNGDEGKPNPSAWNCRPKQNESFSAVVTEVVSSRNKRSVWTVATAPYSEAHFATFPPDLIKPCIMAGTSAKGCCPLCGAPWERQLIAEVNGVPQYNEKSVGQAHHHSDKHTLRASHRKTETVNWQPTCECGCDTTEPCAVLDPFGGSGTVGQVAMELGRKAILCELNPDYIPLIEQRTNITPGLQLA